MEKGIGPTEARRSSYELGELFKKLEASELDESRMARLEWAFLPLLRSHGPSARILHRELARNPDFFCDIIALVYRAEGEELTEVSDEQQARARRGNELLNSWQTLPGMAEDRNIDPVALEAWVRSARGKLAASGRAEPGDRMIGKLLSHAAQGNDGIWFHPAVREVIEEVASTELERGIEVGVYNSRGMVSRGLMEGGRQERQLADQYRACASAISDRWPRTAAMLRRIEASYRAEARSEDISAELRKDGLWE